MVSQTITIVSHLSLEVIIKATQNASPSVGFLRRLLEFPKSSVSQVKVNWSFVVENKEMEIVPPYYQRLCKHSVRHVLFPEEDGDRRQHPYIQAYTVIPSHLHRLRKTVCQQ